MGVFAGDAGMDPPFVERISQYPERTRERVLKVDVLAIHIGTVECLLGADDIGDAVCPVPDAGDRLHLFFVLPGEVFGERDDERHNFLPAGRSRCN